MGETKRLLVISDNHGSEYEISTILKEFGGRFDALVHCGDSHWSPEYLESLVDCPVYCAKGNCDVGFLNREEEVFEFCGHTCLVTHGHRYGVSWDLTRLMMKGLEAGADIIFYGHTHVPDYEEYEEEGIIIMNPGSTTQPRQMNPQRTFLMVEFEEDGNIRPKFYTI